jgi:predicted GIY-YIG superfamily endonuclease
MKKQMDLVVDEIDEQENENDGQEFFVYLLVSDDNSTYIGATVNLERRLRQHNKLIKGGAYATGSKVKKGQVWERAAHIEGFPSWSAALQFEWRWKQLSRKLSPNMFPLERRLRALKTLLELEKPTSKALPYADWSKPIKVIIETGEAQNYYDSIFTISYIS